MHHDQMYQREILSKNRVSGDGCKTLVGGRGLGGVVWCGGLRKLLVATESQRTGVGGSERQTLTKLTVLRGFTPLEQMSRWT